MSLSGIYFWAETPDAPQPPTRRGRVAKKPKPKPHPFATAPKITGRKTHPHPPTPRCQGHPRPIAAAHPYLEYPRRRKNAFSFYCGCDLGASHRCGCPSSGIIRPPADSRRTLAWSRDLLPDFWGKAASLALETLAAQKLIPIIEGKEARWLPVLDSPRDAQRLSQLEAAMPPICRGEFPELSSKKLAAQLPEHLLRFSRPHLGQGSRPQNR